MTGLILQYMKAVFEKPQSEQELKEAANACFRRAEDYRKKNKREESKRKREAVATRNRNIGIGRRAAVLASERLRYRKEMKERQEVFDSIPFLIAIEYLKRTPWS